MQSNLSIRSHQPVFKANISSKFLDAADAYFKTNKTRGQYKQFCCAVRRFSEIPNSDHITISYKKATKNDELFHELRAYISGQKDPVVLTSKNQFRKLLEKFSYMNEYEFKIKTGLINKAE